ncbi:MAG TPA: hypothetical protein GXX35_02595 [Thermoanaerobacterales bacterium]|nr:hypothetical protein [Thermoanaerobacterales bacterium]
MDSVAAAIVGGAISAILILIKEFFMDHKNYKELKAKIGDTCGGDLTNQHKKIEGLINEGHNSIKEVLKRHALFYTEWRIYRKVLLKKRQIRKIGITI